MPHRNAPLTPEGRRRLCLRVDSGRPIAHVAAEASVSRRCLAKWYARWQAEGDTGLADRPSRPRSSPRGTPDDVADLIEEVRRSTKFGAARLAAVLQAEHGITVAPVTVHRVLARRGISRVADLDPPSGRQLRKVLRYEHDAPGSMIHVDVKKLGRIPAGGGWRVHGRGTDAARASKRRGQETGAVGYTYLHTALDDFSRLAYTEPLEDEKGVTAAGFWRPAAAFFAEHGITEIRRVLTDNGACYRSRAWAEALATTGTVHKRTRPYTPRTNGKVERFNGTLAREWAYVREYASEQERRAALPGWLNHYNHERPHSALGQRPPASRVPSAIYRLTASGIETPTDSSASVQLSFDDLTA
jgi:transposase InsO family protein